MPIRCLLFCLLTFLCVGSGFAQTATVSGQLTKPSGEALPDFAIVAHNGTNAQIAYTDIVGQYTFELPTGASYTIRPLSDDLYLNGVTTYDRVLIERHLNNIALLNSPYQYIAADVNSDQVLDSTDIDEISRMILNHINEWTGSPSWRFVPTDFVFPDPDWPWVTPFPEEISLINLSADQTAVNFTAIKLGDINYSAFGFSTPVFTPSISGSIVYDQNENCAVDALEPYLDGWTVLIQNESDTIYQTVRGNKYSVQCDPGFYDVILFPPNNLWNICNDTILNVELTPIDAQKIDFAVQAVELCPQLQVSLSTANLIPCAENFYIVEYCNLGTAVADNAYVELTLDNYFNPISYSSISASNINGPVYTFPIGDVQPGDCASFFVIFSIDCAAPAGYTHCSSAHIYPDSFCIPPQFWDGSDLRISGQCMGNNAEFVIENKGNAMSAGTNYVVVEDVMIQMTMPLPALGNGQTHTVTLPANGSTWRVELAQTQNNPLGQLISGALEGCGTNTSGTFSTGIVNQFPLHDESPFDDEDCRENSLVFFTDQLLAFPTGVDEEHFINPNQSIDYLIRFQNTSSDSVYSMTILDTLPQWLDPSTLVMGTSSHFSQMTLTGNGILKWTLPNIQLPPAATNALGSNGFIQFTIQQRPDLALGTLIENRANIYYDYNDPAVTNRMYHTVGEKYLNLNTVNLNRYSTQAAPNPCIDKTTIMLDMPAFSEGYLMVYSADSRLVAAQPMASNSIDYATTGLTQGVYTYKIVTKNAVVATGKFNVIR